MNLATRVSSCATSIRYSFTLIAAAFLLCMAIPLSAQVPISQRVVLVVDENTSYSTVHPSGMPWLVSEGDANGYATNYFSNTNGSLTDYLWLASGSDEGCNGNNCNGNPIMSDNIFRLMTNTPITWKVYALNYLNAGGTVTTPDQARGTLYFRRHNGATFYSDILSNVFGSQGQIVDFEQFPIDVANGTLPRYSIIVPDGTYDKHNGTLTQADTFLQDNLAGLLASPDFQTGGSGLLIVTFDNGDNDDPGNIYTAMIGPNIQPHFVSNVHYQHQNALRTMLDSLGITTYPGASATAADMSDFFTANAGGVAVNSPANQSIQGTSVLVNAQASEDNTTIDHMEVWDNGNKLGNVFSTSINQRFTLSAGTHQMTVQDIGPGPSYSVLHKVQVDFTVSGTNGVTITTPADGSTQSVLLPLNAFAVESSSVPHHLEIWDSGTKLGNSPLGTTVSQFFTVPTGAQQLTVKDVTSSNQVLHTAQVNVTVSSAQGVYVNSPANGSTQGTSVLVNAYAYEQINPEPPPPFIPQLIDHMDVWDNGVKLGNSPTGYGQTSLFINQTYTLSSGAHQMTIEDIGPGPNFSVIHKTMVNFTVN